MRGVTASPRRRVTSRRPASVLVLVMTLLGVLFVIGVAFLATMNFEAEMIAAQSHQNDRSQAVGAASDQAGMLLQDIFANPTGGEIPYAELPQVNATFSPVEPGLLVDAGFDGILGTGDDGPSAVVYPWITDPLAVSGAAPVAPRDAVVDPGLQQGWEITVWGERCVDGPQKGQPCPPATCPGSICKAPLLLDADGDGVNDSVRVLARDLGLSEQQVSALAAQVNPPSNPGGRVFAAIRIVPHGGMINLNDAHPAMIDSIFADLVAPSPTIPFHSPRDRLVFYSPLIEEAGLRSRGILPAYLMSPSLLTGDPFTQVDGLNADMSEWLMWRDPQNVVQTVRSGEHRFEPFIPCDPLGGSVDCLAEGEGYWWHYRMEPFTSAANFNNWLGQYDRRHLVTTISHDDLLARPTTVPLGGSRRAQLLEKMREVNASTDGDLDSCVPAFDLPNYPSDLPNGSDPVSGKECNCPKFSWCNFDDRKGRLKLSLAWLQRMLDSRKATLDPVAYAVSVANNDFADDLLYAPRLIHDFFAAMLSNLVDGGPAFCDPANPCPAGQICDAGSGRCRYRPCSTTTDCPTGSYCLARSTTATTGRCTAVASFWDDQECAGPVDCAPAGEFCNLNIGATPGEGLCVDAFTGLPRSQARLSRTAASLTANMIDFADNDDVPTRIALRNFDPTRGFCSASATATGAACQTNADCDGSVCNPPAAAYGQEFETLLNIPHLEPSLPAPPSPVLGQRYVYGLEPQPFITEVGIYIERSTSDTSKVGDVTARAVELFIPYSDFTIRDYYLAEAANGSSPRTSVEIPRWGPADYDANSPFLTLVSAANPGAKDLILGTPAPPANQVADLGSAALTFKDGWTIYLIRRVQYPNDPTPTYIVVDQFTVTPIPDAGAAMPADCPNDADPPIVCRYSLERAVAPNTIWNAPVPVFKKSDVDDATWCTWNNTFPEGSSIHPVEVQFAHIVDTPQFATSPFSVGVFTRTDPFDTRSEAFPTLGSLLLPLRVANRDIADYEPPLVPGTQFANLAFTPELNTTGSYRPLGVDPTGVALTQIDVRCSQQIDNGRLPIFDVGVNVAGAGDFGIHHVPPQLESQYNPATFEPSDPATWASPGSLRANPWGQLVFDYFTTLPLSNPGPYVCQDPDDPDCLPVDVDPGAKPRVDQDGLRVHGRVNLNAAPWKSLAGVPFVPLSRLPGFALGQVKGALNLTDSLGNPLADTVAGTLGDRRAQAIVAYREAREIGYQEPAATGPWFSTGDYGDPPNATTPGGFRGWQNPTPLVRRGTGLMSVGELANVRHPTPRNSTSPSAPFFFSAIGVDTTATNNPLVESANTADNNNENFIAAAAPLIALNEWVSVRSHVFTVYGVFRGEENPDITDPDQLTQHLKRQQDIDSRAIRFQETIDRLPVFLGQPLPQRIGQRVTGSYTDYRSN